MAAGLEVAGGPELRAALRALKADLRDLSAIHRDIARDLCAAIVSTAPVGPSGRLGISFRPSGTRTTAKVRSSVVYAPIIEYGWPGHNIAGQHYGEHALNANLGRIRSKYSDGVEKLLRKAER